MTRTAMAPAWLVLLVIVAVLCSVAAVPGRALAQEPEGAGTSQTSQPEAPKSNPVPDPKPMPSATNPTPVSKAPLAQLAWLAGCWQGAWGPRVAHQVWMPPQSGVMAGVFQLTENGQTIVIEIYTIIATPDGIELRVRHFTPTLTAWTKPPEPAMLKLMTYDSNSFLFVNQDNGQPKHWLMKRIDPGTYVARFEIVPEKGQPQSAEITYHRQENFPSANH